MNFTVYTKPNCEPCNATKRKLAKLVTSHGITFDVVELFFEDGSENAEAMAAIAPLGYRQAPVVTVGDMHWAGYSPDKLLAAAEASAASEDITPLEASAYEYLSNNV